MTSLKNRSRLKREKLQLEVFAKETMTHKNI